MRLAKTPKTALRYALKMMNNSGAHWIKGTMRGFKKDERAWCSTGSIREAAGGRMTPVCKKALILLADQIDPKRMEKKRKALESYEGWYTAMTVEEILAKEAQSIIINWNDHENRRWRDVERKFRKAIDAA
jgi:hypothetical protein